MYIYCCQCEKEVEARLTNRNAVYGSGSSKVPMWECPCCLNYVGCHHKTKNPTRPLGSIPTPEIRKARSEIHKILDPLWRSGLITRRSLYGKIKKAMGAEYHTAQLSSIEDCRVAYLLIKQIGRELIRENS